MHAMENDDPDYRRLCWHSRRGMLELDLVLEPFVRHCYPSLPPEDQARYRRLLECDDQDLFAWLLGQGTAEDRDHAHIVARIMEYTRAQA